MKPFNLRKHLLFDNEGRAMSTKSTFTISEFFEGGCYLQPWWKGEDYRLLLPLSLR